MKLSKFINEMETKYKVADEGAKHITKVLTGKGFKAYIAGGFVRDLVMGANPNDVDVVTNATPDEVEHSFPRTYPVGKSFGVVRVLVGDEEYEVATFRKDSLGSDGRRPDSVVFGDEKDDSERRDFTINSMFLDTTKDDIIDYNNGLEDIKNKVIRFIGNPQDRINEDYLRILRAVRFAVRLGFKIDPKTMQAVKDNAPNILKISQERITDEIFKMLKLGQPRKMIELLDETGLLKFVLPEINNLRSVTHDSRWNHHGETALEHTIEVMERMVGNGVKDPVVLFAGMVHDIGKPVTISKEGDDIVHFLRHEHEGKKIFEKMAERMKLPTDLTDRISWIIENHMLPDFDNIRMARFKRMVAHPHFKDVFDVAKGDKLTLPKNKELFDRINARLKKVEEDGAKPKPFITGRDLIDMGMKPGPKFKELLDNTYDEQLEGKLNDREEALDFVRRSL